MTKSTDDQLPDDPAPDDPASDDQPPEGQLSDDSPPDDQLPEDQLPDDSPPEDQLPDDSPPEDQAPDESDTEESPPDDQPPDDEPAEEVKLEPPPPEQRGVRRLAAILFADVAGYTALSSHDEDLALSLIRSFQRLSKKTVTEKGGRVVKFLGDGMLAEFSSLDSAVNAAHALQSSFPYMREVEESHVSLRVGVHLGDIVFGEDGDVYGSGVNVASRIESHAPLAGVVVSDSAYQQLRHRRHYIFSSIGEKDLKGVPDPMELYVVLLEGQEPPGPALLVPAQGGAPSKPVKKRSKMRWMAVGFALAAGVAAVALDLGGIQVQLDDLLYHVGITPVFGHVVYVEPPLGYSAIDGGAAVGSDITVEFSGPIDPATATRASVRLLGPDDELVPTEVRAVEGAQAVVINPLSNLAYETRFRIELTSALQSQSGEAIRAPGASGSSGDPLSFVTQRQPLEPPVVASTNPVDGSTGVDRAAPLSATFSQPMDPETFDSTTVTLIAESGAQVAVALTCCGENRDMLRIDPVEPLANGRYTVVLGEGITDGGGRPLAQDSFGFRVGQVARRVTPTGPGRLTVEVVPASVASRTIVVIDGERVGEAPIENLEVSEGVAHRIEIFGTSQVSRETIRIYDTQRTLSPGQRLTVSAEVTPFGTINIASVPGGTVFIDGEEIGPTPLVSYPVAAGPVHTLEIRPLAANAATHGPYVVDFSVELLEDKSLGRVELPVR